MTPLASGEGRTSERIEQKVGQRADAGTAQTRVSYSDSASEGLSEPGEPEFWIPDKACLGLRRDG